jgi:hypothetical protein
MGTCYCATSKSNVPLGLPKGLDLSKKTSPHAGTKPAAALTFGTGKGQGFTLVSERNRGDSRLRCSALHARCAPRVEENSLDERGNFGIACLKCGQMTDTRFRCASGSQRNEHVRKAVRRRCRAGIEGKCGISFLRDIVVRGQASDGSAMGGD